MKEGVSANVRTSGVRVWNVELHASFSRDSGRYRAVAILLRIRSICPRFRLASAPPQQLVIRSWPPTMFTHFPYNYAGRERPGESVWGARDSFPRLVRGKFHEVSPPPAPPLCSRATVLLLMSRGIGNFARYVVAIAAAATSSPRHRARRRKPLCARFHAANSTNVS